MDGPTPSGDETSADPTENTAVWYPEVQPPYEPGQWIELADFDPARLRPGYHLQNGRITRIRASARPPNFPPEVWNNLDKKHNASWIGPLMPRRRATPSSACRLTAAQRVDEFEQCPAFGHGPTER